MNGIRRTGPSVVYHLPHSGRKQHSQKPVRGERIRNLLKELGVVLPPFWTQSQYFFELIEDKHAQCKLRQWPLVLFYQ